MPVIAMLTAPPAPRRGWWSRPRATAPVTSSTGPRSARRERAKTRGQSTHCTSPALVLDRHEDRAGLAAGVLAGDGPARHPQHRPIGRLRHGGGWEDIRGQRGPHERHQVPAG